MGVHNLKTLVNRHADIYRDVEFKYSRLVIDGANLVYVLYFSSGLDQNRGGEYGAFEDLVERFFQALRDCGVSPYVVFDGCSDLSDRKRETVTSRAEQRILKAHRAAVEDTRAGILPQLARAVFKQTLSRLDVPMGRNYTEADQEMAALAQDWKCPVLSDDSDFYVFPLTEGTLPTSHFRWKEVRQGGAHRYIPCKKYHYLSFCSFFGIEPQFLSVFAVLAGNDFVTLRRQDFDWAQYVPETNDNRKLDELKGILRWIRNQENITKAKDMFERALTLKGNVPESTRKEQLKGLLRAVQDYSLPRSALSSFFSKHQAPPLPPEFVALVPDWMRLPVTDVWFSSDFLDVLTMQRMSLSAVVDHKDKASAKLVSRPLRRVLYALLLGADSSETVEERDRDGLQLKYTRVKPASSVPPELSVRSLPQTAEAQRLQVLLDALGVNEERLSALPSHLSHLRLPLAATCYWLQKAMPPPHLSLLKALLIGWSKGDTLRHKAAQDPDSKRHLDFDLGHLLNQWQSCLKESSLLNRLLGRPLPDPPCARLYNGTLVHLLLHKMSCNKLKSFVKYEPSSVNVYRTLLAIARRFLRPARPSAAAAAVGQKAQPQHDPQRTKAVNLSASAVLLFLSDPDEETETEIQSQLKTEQQIRLEELVPLKTRHKTKERVHRCNDVELLRKQDRRGGVGST